MPKPSAPGTLIMAANGLGNPEDVPMRSLQALREAELHIFEEDRAARAALKAAGLTRTWLRWSEQCEAGTLEALSRCLEAGGTAVYMSSQGCPVLEDPGTALVGVAARLGAQVRSVGGPSSVTTILGACPFPVKGFVCEGLLPREPAARRRCLQDLARLRRPLVLLETPYRRDAFLADCAKELAGREAVLALDLGGPEERFLLAEIEALPALAAILTPKLNFLLAVAAPKASKSGR
jgi:16S rRNA (cytidine1402-2'-O)-methyltransferase